MFESNESWSFKNFSGQGKQSVLMTVRQCKFIIRWKEFAKSIKLLISVSGRVHTENMSSINLFQRNGSHAVVVSQREP